ncbi:TetR/AcrR family transcriptional regulator [Kineosporia rhizophila]|uniref:TetR family transcriptional regulator n=1 Tax=Kineosporia TaxID=49184 RepID=UPI000AF6AD10|nr:MULTISPECIES: TetR family transcriptional regulator [Kineosporia]MCE0538167.1 TetR/AcrR family transcriptional regulator [Kineosporia rhizophila]GLY15001.1 TetR family transcriptional regulator [Kineosporia sp. NBRC 101677]
MEAKQGDLRQRRRKATEREIHEATLRLVGEHGFEHVTVDMISSAAGISRRTFFNYFPSKEAAVIAGPTVLPDDALAEFLAQPGQEPVQVLRDLTRLLLRELSENQPQREELSQVMELAQQHPALMAAMLTNFERFERSVGEVAAQRLGLDPLDVTPVLITSLAFSAIRTGLQSWSRSPHSSPDLLPQVEQTVALFHSFLAP